MAILPIHDDLTVSRSSLLSVMLLGNRKWVWSKVGVGVENNSNAWYLLNLHEI